MSSRSPKRLGNRVVRRRLDAERIIDLPEEDRPESRPTATVHAKKFVLAVLVIFLIGGALLTLPISTTERVTTNPVDAFFVAVSAFSVTGLVTVDTQAHWSFFGQFVILVLIQIGGFGFMAGTSLVLIALGRGSSLRANMMMQDGSPTMSLQEVSRFSLRIVRYMVVVEVLGAIVLTAHFLRYESFTVAVWSGVFYSVSSFCNAGFDLQGGFGSLSAHHGSPLLLGTIAILIQFGALSYMVVADVWRTRRWRPLQLDTKLVLIANTAIAVTASILILAMEWNGAMAGIDTRWKPLNAVFQAMAARTAGFASIDWSHANDSTMYMWILMMMTGGAAGSTTGGVKLATIAVIVLAVASTVRGQSEPQAFGRRLSAQIVYRALAILALFMATHFVLSFMLALTEDLAHPGKYSFVSLMFESMSALATVGLSTGVTEGLSAAGKIVLIVGMFIGRLGPITVAYALQNRQRRERFRYAEATIRIG